jgi:hypothetical protein
MPDRNFDTPSGDQSFFDDSHDSRMARNRTLPVRGPKSWRMEKAGLGSRAVVFAWPADSIEVSGSSATQFVIKWAESLDESTQAGIDAGYARTTVLSPAIATSGENARPDQPLTAFFPDPKYLTGYFFCVGQNADGEESDPGIPFKLTDGTGGTIPFDVEHFRATENGEQHGQMTFSVIDYAFRIPVGGGPIDKVQFMYRNYPNLNEFSEGESVRVTVGRGGTQTGKLRIPIGRRIGEGTISISGTTVTGTGTNFLSVAAQAGGDQLEVFGVRGYILSVTDNETMELLASWGGPDVTNVADWQTIATIVLYAVSEDFTGARRDDVENAPHVALELDGLLSAPLAPVVTATPLGNAVRLVIEPEAGTELARALLYKKEGSGLAFDKATWDMIHAFAIDNQNPAPFFQWDDTDFSTYAREQGTVFSYAATVVNVRDQESDASDVVEAAPRLDSGADGSDPVGKIGLKNLLFNGGFDGTIGTGVAPNDTSQYSSFGGVTIGTHQPGRPYGTTAGHGAQANGLGNYRGYTSWESNDGGTGASGGNPTFEGAMVQINPPGIGKDWYVYQEVGAWDSGTAPFVKLKKDGLVCWAILLAKDPGSAQPDGTISVYIDLYDNGTFRGEAPRRYRDSATDALLYVTGGAAHVDVSGAALLSDWTLYFGIFRMDSTVGTVRQARFNVAWFNGTQGKVWMSEAMVNTGEERGAFTTDMGDITVSWPIPTNPPGDIGDGDGHRDGHFDIP